MRHTKTVKLADRGKEKTYLLTEMPVFKAEKWAMRVILALIKGGADIDIDPGEGMAGMAQVAMSALGGLSPEVAEPLLDEMMTCVQIQTSAGIYRGIREDQEDIEDLQTLFALRKEILSLHFDFFKAAAASN